MVKAFMKAVPAQELLQRSGATEDHLQQETHWFAFVAHALRIDLAGLPHKPAAGHGMMPMP